MPFALIFNEYKDKGTRFTPFMVAFEAYRRGREVWVANLDDLSLTPDARVMATVAMVPPGQVSDLAAWVAAIKEDKVRLPGTDLSRARTVLLRNNPNSQDRYGLSGGNAGIDFGFYLQRHGVRVINDPTGLTRARTKAYLNTLPDGTAPRTLVTRDIQQVREYLKELGGRAVIKPADGFGGSEVFLYRPEAPDNVGTIVEIIRRHSFVCVQEFVSEAEEGDLRVILIRGELPRVDGKPAAYRRVHGEGEFRNNIHTGGRGEKAVWTEREEEVCRAIGPQLRRDGLHYVGLDLVGGKVIDLNVFNPGGLRLMGVMHEVDFCPAVVDMLESD